MDLKKSKEGHVRAWKEDREMGKWYNYVIISENYVISEN